MGGGGGGPEGSILPWGSESSLVEHSQSMVGNTAAGTKNLGVLHFCKQYHYKSVIIILICNNIRFGPNKDRQFRHSWISCCSTAALSTLFFNFSHSSSQWYLNPFIPSQWNPSLSSHTSIIRCFDYLQSFILVLLYLWSCSVIEIVLQQNV